MRIIWFTALFSAICLEGLGRRYLPQIPSTVFYFLKDVVLFVGYLRFKPSRAMWQTTRYLYRGFEVVLVAAIAWTVIEIFNPEQQSFPLALIGLRAYWVWWIAPPVIAGVLQNRRDKQRAIYVLLVMAVGISALAAVQFASPADSGVNMYTVQDGQEIYATEAVVAMTGRARVSSTFAFLSGFVAFTILVPAVLLSIGLDEAQDRKVRRAAFIATFASAAVVPMSGSRSSILLGVSVLLLTAWSAGLLFTPVGRRVLIGGIVAAVLATVAFPDALVGVESRFGDTDETSGRIMEIAMVLPPVALATVDYPTMGLGTGMQQNARFSLHVTASFEQELEIGRYLVELGPIGFLLVWTAKLGLMVALLRAYAILKRAGRRGAAGAALSYAALTLPGSLAFDHNWQALYFTGVGFILAEVVSARRVLMPEKPATAALVAATTPR